VSKAAEPELHLRRDAVRDGWSDDELGRLVRAGQLGRVRRGAYVAGPIPRDITVRHRLLVRATVAGLRRPAAVSHQSAAVLHGLPLWGVPLARVHVTRRPRASTDVSGTLHCHVASFRDDEVVDIGGIPVTSVVRTLLDLARSLPHEQAVVALDGALFARRSSKDDLRMRLMDIVGTPGSRSAARAVAFADGRSESVGESRSRVILHRWGLGPTTIQFDVLRGDGSTVGRTDFAWEDRRLVGEFDGRVKYGRLLRPGQSPGDAVFDEKRREDEIRDEGWGVIRWVWSELDVPHRFAARIRRQLARPR
jgi:hypothetical protein